MRKIAVEPDTGIEEIQDFLHPKPIIKSKKYVIAAVHGFIWVGKVFRTEWRGPKDNYDELLDRFDAFVSKKLFVTTTVFNCLECKLFDPYSGDKSIYSYTPESVVQIPVHDHYKFMVHFPLGFEEYDSKVMRTGALGIKRVEESIEHFKSEKLT